MLTWPGSCSYRSAAGAGPPPPQSPLVQRLAGPCSCPLPLPSSLWALLADCTCLGCPAVTKKGTCHHCYDRPLSPKGERLPHRSSRRVVTCSSELPAEHRLQGAATLTAVPASTWGSKLCHRGTGEPSHRGPGAQLCVHRRRPGLPRPEKIAVYWGQREHFAKQKNN